MISVKMKSKTHLAETDPVTKLIVKLALDIPASIMGFTLCVMVHGSSALRSKLRSAKNNRCFYNHILE